MGCRVDAVDDEQGQKGEEPEAFTDALTRILQPFDPTVSVGSNSGLYDSTAEKPKYVSIVASGAVQQAAAARAVRCKQEGEEIQGSQERQTWPSNSSGRPRTARFGAGPISAISADFGLQGPNGRVQGGGRRRRNRANWAKPRRRRVYGRPKPSFQATACPLAGS